MTDSTKDGHLAWADLVSDGHVRAARLRWMQPWLITFGALALVIGFYIQIGVRAPTAPSEASTSLEGQVEEARRPVAGAIAGLPEVSVPPDQYNKLALFSEIGKSLVPMILDNLTKAGTLPADQIEIKTLSPDDFWRKAWPNTALVTTGTDDVRLVGGIVNRGNITYVQPTRWLGVFRKKAGVWDYATAEGPEFVEIPDRKSVSLEQIPLTLASVVPKTETPDSITTALNVTEVQ